MWSDIFIRLSHIFNLLDNISILILLENKYEMEKELKGGSYLRVKLLDQMIWHKIEKIRPFLELKRSIAFRNMNIGGCMCVFCQEIGFDTSATMETMGEVLEHEIGSLKGLVGRCNPVINYQMTENGQINPINHDWRIFLGRLEVILHQLMKDLDVFFPIFTYNDTL